MKTASPARSDHPTPGTALQHCRDLIDFVRFVANRLSRNTYVNIMAQYRSEHKARQVPELSRRITAAEYRQAVRWAKEAGLTRLDQA